MTVFFLSTEFNYCCGVSRSILSLAQELTNRGHRIIIGTPIGVMVKDLEALGILHVNIPIYPQKKNIKDFIKSIWLINKTIKKFRVDIIHSHNRFAELLSLIANSFSRLPTITTSHSLVLGMKQISFRSNKVIAPSLAVEKMLVDKFKVKPYKISIIKNIPRKLTIPSLNEICGLKERIQLKIGEFVIVGIGRMHKEKGFDILLEALKRCENDCFRLIIVGKGDEKDSLERYVQENNLKVNFIDELNKIELIYSIADVVVVPSRQETVGLVAIESSYFSKPVIATEVGGLVETITHGETGLLVKPESPEDIASAINWVFHNKKLATKIGQQLTDYIDSKYNASFIASQIETVYSG